MLTVAPEAYETRRDFLKRTAVTAGLAAAMGLVLDPDTVVAEAARRQRRGQAPVAAQPADRHVRGADDGEPLLRPLPRLAAGRRRPPGGPAVHRHPRARSSPPTACDTSPGLRLPGPRPLVGRRAHRAGRRAHGRLPARRVATCSRSATTTEDGPAVHPARRPRRSPPSIASSARCSVLDLPQPRVHARRPVLRDGSTTRCRSTPAARVPGHDDLRRAAPSRRLQPLLLHRHPGLGPVGQPGPVALEPGPGRTTSSAAAGTLPALSFVDPAFKGEEPGHLAATSTRTATSASARRSSPTSSTPSWSSPQFKRGALFIVYDEWGGFFDHVVPPRVPDLRAEPQPRRRTSARWASGSRPWSSRPTPAAATSTTRSTASSRSSR